MKRILVLTPRFPFPVLAGDSVRIYNMCRKLADQHALTLLSLCGNEEEWTTPPEPGLFAEVHRVYLPQWKSLLHTAAALFTSKPLQLAYYTSSEFARKVDALTPEHDLVLAHLIRTGQYVEGGQGCPKVLEMTDAISMNYKRVAALGSWGLKPLVYRIEAPRLERYERRAARNFDLVSLVSPVDKAFLTQEKGIIERDIQVYTNGVDTQRLAYVGPGDEPTLAFIGNMRTAPNRAACTYIIDEVLPRIRERIPQATFRIVGDAPPATLKTFGRQPHVTMTGRVDRISEGVRGALCGVGVMRTGAGVQNKILEYMALGLPVLANAMGLEGIEAEPGTEVLSGESPEALAEHVVRLYRDRSLREALAQAGRAYVERHHQWDVLLQDFVHDVEALM